MDKEWTKLPRLSREYEDGVESFLDFAFADEKPQGGEIPCPCAKCRNIDWQRRNVVHNHLIAFGFLKGYDVWVNHGERIPKVPMEIDDDMEDQENPQDNIGDLLYDTFRHVAEAEEGSECLNEDAKKFYNLINEAKQELYPGCENFSTLSFIIRLYLLKCLHGWSNASFTALLELLKEAVPNLNIPESYNKTKAMIRDLGLDYKKIHACPNDCMLYWKEHENDDSCSSCKASRWKEFAQVDSEYEEPKYVHKVPAKILRHFPLIPRLQRLFMCSKTAEEMRWHEEGRSKDGKLRHPADGQAWKDFDRLHPDFASEPRNVRLGLSSDGFNPFRTMSISHSTWPVMMVIYNYPPWLCMKSEYTMLSLLIPGPQSPGNDIDVYLQPLIEELKELWEFGVDTYDASRNQTFQLRASLLWTISDYPGYAMLSGWSTKGKLACACCNYDTNSIYLRHSHKMCYMDHRVFLPINHAWRTNRKSFNGKKEHRSAPPMLEGTEIIESLKDFKNEFGKKKKKKKIDGPWKKKSIFFELPYWAQNTLRHNLDVMHIEKNICDNIIGTLLDISGKTKDHVNARYDLQDMGIRKKLHPMEIAGGRAKFAKACFSLSAQEKSIFCGVLKAAKLPDGSASNISKCVQVADKKIFGYKSHDAHFMLHYLLQVAIKSTLPNAVAEPLIRLGSFFRSLCQKVFQMQDLDYLKAEIAEILCQLEMIFPPSFFDIMVHLPIHLVDEVRLGGPVQFRWMYPTERNLCKLKSYVRNKAYPEGSIAEGYLAEEALTLCSRYFHKSVETRLNRKSRNYDNSDSCDVDSTDYFSSIGRPLGGKQNGKPFSIDSTAQAQAHRYILFNCDDVQKYIREHEDCVKSRNKRGKWIKSKTQSQDFSEWFKTRALEDDVSFQLKAFSRGPNTVAKRFSGYLINGYRFHTKKRDARRKTQNSGVTLVSLTESFASSKDENPKTDLITYYGAINDIIELDYYSHFKFVLFKCDWFEAEEDNHGLTCVHFNKKCYQNDPFVLASQVHQCFYVQDPLEANKHYVMKTVPRDLFNMGDQSDVTTQEGYQSDPFDDIGNLNALNNDDEINWIREDILATVTDKPAHAMRESEHLDPTKKKVVIASMAQPKVLSQNQDPKKFVTASQKKLTSEASMTKNQGSKQIQDPKGHLMTQSKGSIQNQHPKRQPMKKIVIEEVESPMKRSLAENDNLRTKKKPIKRVSAEDDEIRESLGSATKKTKRIPLCRSMLIEEFLKENEELDEEEEGMGNETDSEDEEYVMEQEEDGENSDNVIEGTSKKRTRGPTQCLQIHARKSKDRQEVILDDDGEPIGPDDKIVSDLSYFLGTIARNASFCPLIYTNFRALVNDHKERIWEYVQDKYIISDRGEKAVFSRINDAWRRYKCYIKRMHFLKYSTSKERLKHRPTSVPEAHFKKLMAYWRNDTIQNISQKNADNRSKQKYMHRTGPINFARIRAKLRAKKDNGEEVTQAEMFIETRQSRKGKEVDEETQTAIAKLQDSIENSTEAVDQAFQSLLGKEKPGRVRCYGRTATPSMLKKNQEIATINKHYDDELSDVKKRMQAYESLLKSVLKQQHPNLSEEDVDNMMGRAMGMTNTATLHSSTSTHVPEKSVHEDHPDEDHPEDE